MKGKKSSAKVAQEIHFKIRDRLERWEMPIHIGHRAERLRRRLALLQEEGVAPGIRIVYFKTALNAWVTERRMSSFVGAGTLERCPVCANGKDSLEHSPNAKNAC